MHSHAHAHSQLFLDMASIFVGMKFTPEWERMAKCYSLTAITIGDTLTVGEYETPMFDRVMDRVASLVVSLWMTSLELELVDAEHRSAFLEGFAIAMLRAIFHDMPVS